MISFDLDADQKQIKDMVSRFAKDEVRDHARHCDEEEVVPAELIQKAWELGFLWNAIPEAYGGYGAGHSAVSGAVVAEELSWGDLSLAMYMLAPALFVYPLIAMGTPAQKEKFLPPFTKEKFLPATLAVMEPRYNFDLSDIRTTARFDGKNYVLNGEKCLTPLAQEAEYMLVMAATTPGIGFAGVDAFILDKNTGGVTIGDKEKNMGLKALPTYRVKLEDCKVPKENRLGEEMGIHYLALMNNSRIALAAAAVGVCRAALEYAIRYAKERFAFGEPIGSRQAIAFMLAEMAIEVDATRLLTWKAAWKEDNDMDSNREAYLAKKYAGGMAINVTDRAVQALGGHGYIRDHLVELWLRNGRGFSAFEGLITV